MVYIYTIYIPPLERVVNYTINECFFIYINFDETISCPQQTFPSTTCTIPKRWNISSSRQQTGFLRHRLNQNPNRTMIRSDCSESLSLTSVGSFLEGMRGQHVQSLRYWYNRLRAVRTGQSRSRRVPRLFLA